MMIKEKSPTWEAYNCENTAEIQIEYGQEAERS